MSRRLLGALGLALASLAVPEPASGYRLFGFRADLPLRFRMLENDNLPTDFEITQEIWTRIVSRSFDRWTEIPTAEIRLVLESETVARDQADADDGVNTIGFSSYEGFQNSWATAFAAIRRDGSEVTGCDIEVNPDFRKNWGPQDLERLLEIVAIHEMGHCLGLAHTEPHPMPLWTDHPVGKDPAFLPDPVMSYSNSYAPSLSQDDITAVSLLYPAPGFLETRGAVRGTVRLSGEISGGFFNGPVLFAYVQAVRPGGPEARAGPGPGVFTNEDGDFHLEGLLPGDWMLWVHPILIVRRNAHGNRGRSAYPREFADRLRWIEVAAGETVEGVEITVEPGREVSEGEPVE